MALALPWSLLGQSPVTTNAASWTDPRTQLTWAASDNGYGVSLSQALRYCKELKADGFQDWQLPSIDDLQSLFGGEAGDRGYHVLGPLKLTGWEWSSTPGSQKGDGWALDFGDGARASVSAGDSGLNRALCVRPSSAPALPKSNERRANGR